MSGLISAVSWVPKGVAEKHPKRYAIDDDELERIENLTQSKLADVKEEYEGMQEDDNEDDEWQDDNDEMDDDNNSDNDTANDMETDDPKKPNDPNDLSIYNLDDYDNEERPAGSFMSNPKDLTANTASDDPYLSLEAQDEEMKQEEEDLEIAAGDNLLVAARTEDEVSQLEVYVVEEGSDNIYPHHDLLIPAMPLCLEWMDFAPGRGLDKQPKSNFVAVGTLDPEIEIWSLDVIDGMYPDLILGGSAPTSNTASTLPLSSSKKSKNKKKKKAAPAPINPQYAHTDAVLGLSWNKLQRNILASASADSTVKLWDLSLQSHAPALRSYDFPDKVQAVKWNPSDASVLLSGAFGGVVSVFDSRAPDQGLRTSLGSDIECLNWDPFTPTAFTLGLSSGAIQHFDSRSLSSPLWTLAAHDGAVSTFSTNNSLRGLIATGGEDGRVKLWNIAEQADSRAISLVDSRDAGVGRVFSISFSPDDITALAIAGSEGGLHIWDVAASQGIKDLWPQQIEAIGKLKLTSGIIRPGDDDIDDDDD